MTLPEAPADGLQTPLRRAGIGKGLSDVLAHVAELAIAAIPGAVGAGVVLVADGRLSPVAGSSPFVRSADQLQYRLGEGPCVTAIARARTVRCGDLAIDPAFPTAGPQLAELGVQSALCSPLVADDVVLGSVNVYASAPTAFDDRAADVAALLAVIATEHVLDARKWVSDQLPPDGSAGAADRPVDRATSGELADSLQMLTQIAQAVAVGIYLRDSAKMLYVNPAFMDLFALPADCDPEYMLQDVRSRVHPEDQEIAGATLVAADGVRAAECELRLIFPDGGYRWVHITNSPVPGSGPGAVRVVGTVEDITDRKNAEAALQESENQLRQVADAIAVGVSLREAAADIALYVNPAWIDIVQARPYDDETATAEDVVESLVHPDDRDRVLNDYWPAARAGRSVESEHRIIIPDGSVRWVRATSNPVTDLAGTLVRLAGTVQDITSSKRAEQLAWDAATEAEAANASKSELLSRMSHELRTPLNAVLGFAQILDLELEEPGHRDAVAHILAGGKHLLGLVNDILDITGIESGTIGFEQNQVQVHDFLNEVIDTVSPLAAELEVTIDHQSRGTAAEAWVCVDRRRLRQVVVTLMSNAIKYNHPAGRVDVIEEMHGNQHVAIRIMDTGRGIRLEDLPRLFDPFDRLGKQAAGVEGTGIGLALASRLITALGGRLTVDSAHGVGSTFVVELPVGKPPGADQSAVRADNVLLYVGSDRASVGLLRRILARADDWRLAHAGNAALGLEMSWSARPTAVLLDADLPDVGGLNTLAALRNDPRTADIPIAVLSDDDGPRQARKLLAAGAQLHLPKPIDVRSLLAFLETNAGT